MSGPVKSVEAQRNANKNPTVREMVQMDRIRAWRDNPLMFFEDALGFKPTTWQKELALAIALDPRVNPEGKRRYVVRAGRNVGKTAVLSAIAWWYSTTRLGSVVVITAPTFERQVVKVFFGEIRKWGGQLKRRFPASIDIQKAKVIWERPPIFDELKLGEWSINGESAAQPEKIAGFHASGGNLVIIDEASGVEDSLFDSLEGTISDAKADYRLIISGNPTKRDGEFYRAFEDEKAAHLYYRIQVSSRDSEVADTKQWCDDMLRKHGESSPFYRSQVLGLPPMSSDAAAIISIDALLAAKERWQQNKEVARNERPVIGVDVARWGDDKSVILVRRGARVERIDEISGYDSFAVAEEVVRVIREIGGIYDNVCVDAIGYGAGVVDALRRHGVRLIEVNVARAARDNMRFGNTRAEVYFAIRDWLLAGGEIPPNDDLIADLADVRADFPGGRIFIEAKEVMKKRRGKSPDYADALSLTFAKHSAPDWKSVLAMSNEMGGFRMRNSYAQRMV